MHREALSNTSEGSHERSWNVVMLQAARMPAILASKEKTTADENMPSNASTSAAESTGTTVKADPLVLARRIIESP
jgi:hypothetical protein